MHGGEVIVDMKAGDRHLNKTIKDRVYNAMNANTRTRKGAPKVKPIKEPQDCYKLGRLPSLLRAQLQADNSISFEEKVIMFQTRLLNAITHYFNDERGIITPVETVVSLNVRWSKHSCTTAWQVFVEECMLKECACHRKPCY